MTAMTIASSRRPRPRPADLDTTPAPSFTEAEATQSVTYDPTRPLLLGTYGKPAGRHALLRLPNGAIRTVAPGDRLGRTIVASIGAGTVWLSRDGQPERLEMPGA